MSNIIKDFIKWYNEKKRLEKGKELVLNSHISEEFVQSLIHVVDEHPTTQINIQTADGGKIQIKSRLTDTSIYNEEDLYSVPSITNEVSIAKAVRGKK